MKHKLCISVDEETILKVKAGVRTRRFRNTSHAFEHALLTLLEDDA